MRVAILLFLFAAAGRASAQTLTDVEVSPPEVHLERGNQAQVAATAYTEAGDIVPSAVFLWTSTDTSVVRVVSDPRTPDVETLIAVAPGAAVVESRAGKARGFTVVNVSGGTARADRPIAEAPATMEAKKRIAGCAELLRVPPAGSWAKWQTPRGSIIFAMLGTEVRDGKPFYRIQVATMPGDRAAEGAVMQLLSPTWPTATQGLAELVTQSHGQPPLRVTGARLASMRVVNASNSIRVAALRCPQMIDRGIESVTAPAGVFTAHHLVSPDGDYESWVDPSVPFAVVKTTSKEGWNIGLVAKGTGATSAIMGTPVEMPARPNRGRPAARSRQP